MAALVKMPTDVYVTGDRTIRGCIVTAMPEHVLQEDGAKAFFDYWETEPILRNALDRSNWQVLGMRAKRFYRILSAKTMICWCYKKKWFILTIIILLGMGSCICFPPK